MGLLYPDFILKLKFAEFNKAPSGSFCRAEERLNKDDLDTQF
jgi:hypothetical protein